MGLLINGKWHDQWYDTQSTKGKFVRDPSVFHHKIGSEQFPAEAGRYQLIVSPACPWSHRTMIFRVLKKLENMIDITIVSPIMLENGWTFDRQLADNIPLEQINYLYQLYMHADPNYNGRVTVPVLWDKKSKTIVNNESSEIIRMFNSEFNEMTGDKSDYYPAALREQIDAVNQQVYKQINNGVYLAGFATDQAAYEEAFDTLFNAIQRLEIFLQEERYVVGDQITEADWRLFPTLIRFDAVYYSHFKCNKYLISSFPTISNYLRELYQYPGIAETVDFNQIKTHYYVSQTTINPTQIIAKGPELDFTAPHNRDSFKKPD